MRKGLVTVLWFACLSVACKPAQGGGDAGAAASESASAAATPSPSASAQVQAQLLALKHDAIKLIDQWDLDGAKAKLLEAQKLAPDDEEVKRALASWEEVNASRVGGTQWFKRTDKDAMTDQTNIRVLRAAQDDLSDHRPIIEVRCLKGQPDIMIDVHTVIGDDIYGNAPARYRFDADPPQAMTMTGSEDNHGLFFKEPRKWFDKLMEHASGKLIVEVPIFGRVPQAITFDLAGADVAVQPVKEACAKK